MTPPLSIRSASLDIGKIWDVETKDFDEILSNVHYDYTFLRS